MGECDETDQIKHVDTLGKMLLYQYASALYRTEARIKKLSPSP